jgi:hypothetical protein
VVLPSFICARQQAGIGQPGSGTDIVHWLAVADVEGTYQLTALVLYVRQLAATATSAGKRSFWADWLRQLPRLDQNTAPFGAWSDDELSLLRFQPYKVCCMRSGGAQGHTQRAYVPHPVERHATQGCRGVSGNAVLLCR